MSIGIGNDKYIDLIINKKIFKNQYTIISGCGIKKNNSILNTSRYHIYYERYVRGLGTGYY